METLFQKFKKWASEEHQLEDVSNYISKEPDVYGDDLNSFLYVLASFLEEEWRNRGLDNDVWFVEDVDSSEGKYNRIRAIKTFRVENESFEVEIADYECRWGCVAESEKEFNENLEDFLRRIKRRLDLLCKYLNQERININPSNRYH